MPRIHYHHQDGTQEAADVPVGESVMEGAVKNGLAGIDADCGGACACATCHVYVAEEWVNKIEPPSDMELSMLDFVIGRRPSSRLSCQLKVIESLDGLTVATPVSQR